MGGIVDFFNKENFATVNKAELRRSIISDDLASVTVTLSQPLNIQLGHKIQVQNRDYFLNLTPNVIKSAEREYVYELQYEGVAYLLRKYKLFNLDSLGQRTDFDFPVTTEPLGFLQLIINNANKYSPVWNIGTTPAISESEAKTITFSKANCLEALQMVCSEFKLEFTITQSGNQYTINLHEEQGTVRDIVFEYGKGNGLYSLDRRRVNDQEIITRLYGFGSRENIPAAYRNYSPMLRMPSDKGDYIEDPALVAQFGFAEGIYEADVKPEFHGKVTTVGTLVNGLQPFTSNDMDFDLKAKDIQGNTLYLVPGTVAKLRITKGNLAGKDFEINDYDHTTKTFKIIQYRDERNQLFPDPETIFKLAVGDEFTLHDIVMPETYITAAENKVYQETTKEYQKVTKDNIKYSLNIDPLFMRDREVNLGDYVGIKDVPLGTNKQTRITSLTYDILADKYTFDVADTYEISVVRTILEAIRDVGTVVRTQEKVNRQTYLNGYRLFQELKDNVFDPDGYYDPEKIKPFSVEAYMISTGARSQMLTLESVQFQPNYQGDSTKINITSGKLIHFSINADGTVREWNIVGLLKIGLLASETYYVYARCSRAANTATYIVTTEKIIFDSESDYYNFLLAMVYKPANGQREVSTLYGVSQMSGNQITTGILKSLTGAMQINLETGEIIGKITFAAGSPAQTYIDTQIGTVAQAAAAAQATADAAAVQVSDIANDNKLTPNEKQQISVEWNRIKAEYSQYSIQAANYGVVATAYTNAYNALNTYITPLLASLTTTSTIIGTTFRNNFNTYYTQAVAIITAVEKARVDAVQVGGRNLILGSKRFLDSNSYWLGDFNLTKNLAVGKQYTVTVWTRAVNQNAQATFRIGDEGGDIITLSKISSKEFTVVFTAPRAANKIILFREPNDGSYYQFEFIKLEEGNKATDWTPAPEDIDAAIGTVATQSANALAQAQNAQNTAAALQQVTSFMQTTVDGNVIATGTLAVGDVNGGNAGITGVTDRGSSSIRAWFGAAYSGKDTAPLAFQDRGLIVCHHPNGNLGLEIGLKNGEVVFNGYHETGFKTYEMSPNRGLVNVSYLPESYSRQEAQLLGATYNETTFLNILLPKITSTLIDYGPSSIPGRRYNRQWKIGDVNPTVYLYSAGTHPANEQYKPLEGYKKYFTDRNINADNGWYYFKNTDMVVSEWGDDGVPSATALFFLYRLQDGKVVENKTITKILNA